MEANLNSLIEKIKKEGIQQAESDAARIQADAKKQADKTIAQAQEQANSIKDQARQEAEDFKKASEAALKQASRDALLALRGRVTEFFGRVIKDKVAESLSPEVLQTIITKVIEHAVKEGSTDIEIVLSNQDKQSLEKTLFADLSKAAKQAITLQGKKEIESGFRAGEKGKGSYLDFTDHAIAESFRRYLNPRLVDALDIDLGLKQKQPHGK
jgi:V/A-type H+/Na+-transporting ATPase subunit E